jgi:hypothetical protein
MADGQAGDSRAERTSRTVVALLPSRGAAEAAMRDLLEAGFREDQIGVAMRNPQGDTASAGDGDVVRGAVEDGATKGAVSGGVVGGMVGLLGSLLIPGVGPLVAGGVLASVLAGAGAGAATGGVLGGLIAVGATEEEVRHFEAGLSEGRALLTVDAGARTDEAVAILRRAGADLGPVHGAAPARRGATIEARFESTDAAEAAIHALADAGFTYEAVDADDGVRLRVDGDGRPEEARRLLRQFGDRSPSARTDGAPDATATPKAGPWAGRPDAHVTGAAFGGLDLDNSGLGGSREAWDGGERRRWSDPSFSGPERRRFAVAH